MEFKSPSEVDLMMLSDLISGKEKRNGWYLDNITGDQLFFCQNELISIIPKDYKSVFTKDRTTKYDASISEEGKE